METITGYAMFDSQYYVTRTGNVYFKKHDGFYQPLRLYKNKQTGYMTVKLYKDKGKSHSNLAVHKLVAQHYVPNPENYIFVRHKDGDMTNNNHTNLEWYRSTCIHSPENKVSSSC